MDRLYLHNKQRMRKININLQYYIYKIQIH